MRGIGKPVIAAIAVAIGLASGPSWSDMTVRLKDGQTFRLPVDPEEVESITFQPGSDKTNARKPTLPLAPRARATLPGKPMAKLPPAPQTRRTNQALIGGVIRVGPGRQVKIPSAAARIAADGAIVEIDAGIYLGDVAVWRQNDLTIRGVGGRAHLKAAGMAAEGKGIWVMRGNNVTVENIEFSDARVPDKNGAGIRFEGANLTIRRSHFHDNENGILTGRHPESRILIEHSVFARNGHGDGQSHNIYIGKIKRLILRYNYIHHARIGQRV